MLKVLVFRELPFDNEEKVGQQACLLVKEYLAILRMLINLFLATLSGQAWWNLRYSVFYSKSFYLQSRVVEFDSGNFSVITVMYIYLSFGLHSRVNFKCFLKIWTDLVVQVNLSNVGEGKLLHVWVYFKFNYPEQIISLSIKRTSLAICRPNMCCL